MHPSDPLTPSERTRILEAPRPRRDLPLLPAPPGPRRHLPLAAEATATDRTVRPLYAVWEITLACDLACRHCGSRAGKRRPDELTTAECLDLADQIAALGVKEVTLIGGEAYLREDWLDIVRRVREHGIDCTTTTGGRGFTRELGARAKAAGLCGVGVSIDGDQESHDRLRGVAGSHAAALNTLHIARALEMRVSCNTQINRLSMPHLFQIVEDIARAEVHGWQLQLTVPMGRAADEPDVLLQPYDLLTLFPMLDRLVDRARELGIRIWPGNNIGYFGPYESKLRPERHAGSCGAGIVTLGIEADGSIKGCPSLPTSPWTGANIRDEKLVDIWERSKPLRYMRERTLDDLWGYCRTCYYAENCMAGCTWTSFVTFGRAGNNVYCHHRALEMQRQNLRERIVPKTPAPGEPFDHGVFDIVVEPALP